MSELADLQRQLDEAKKLLREVREEGMMSHNEMTWGCEDCAYSRSSLCGRISIILGET